MSDEKLQFDELDVSIGQIVEALPKSCASKQFTDVMIIGAIPGEAIIISAPPSGVFPKLVEGEALVLRLKMASGVAIMATSVLFISEEPMYMVYLDYPKDVTFKRIRNAARVSVKLPVLVSNIETSEFSCVAGQIIDISTTGASLSLTEYVGAEGEQISMKGKFSVGGIQRILSLRAVIRGTEKKALDQTVYGIEFLADNENDLLVLFGFIFNAMAFGKIQKIR